MNPWAKKQGHVRALAVTGRHETLEIDDRPLVAVALVVPTRQIENRGPGSIVLGAQIEPSPPRIVGWVAQPLVVKRSDLAQPVHVVERQHAEHGKPVLTPRGDGFSGARRPGEMMAMAAVGGDLVPRPANPRHVEDAAGVDEPFLRREGHGRHHRTKVGRTLYRRQPLRGPRIGKTESSDDAGRPRLNRCPFNGVIAVFPLLLIGMEIALGGVTAAHVLHDQRVATLKRVMESAVVPLFLILVVGRSVHQGGERPLPRRTQEIGPQFHAVAHGHVHASLDDGIRGGTSSDRMRARSASNKKHEHCR